jgi:DNA-binding response OmpR family regulator
MRALVIDDEAGYRDLLARQLRREGFEVDTAEDGVDGAAKAAAAAYDLGVVDLTMPRLGGLETVALIRARSPKTRLILITGFASVETAVHAMRHGADDVVLKPFDLDDFITRVKTLLEEPRHGR